LVQDWVEIIGLIRCLYKATNFAAKENLPILIDADGLNILSEDRLKIKLPKKLILTPHPGEAARLLKTKGLDHSKK
jgi:NAD(P)H-hydrate repair Nnr-like enzyme with NAD(P)H-hydrate dehydratase domain